jgi:hypothetical protein
MIGLELKALIVILALMSAFITAANYKEVCFDNKSYLFGLIEIDEGFVPQKSWWVWLFITIVLFAYALCLNEQQSIIII